MPDAPRRSFLLTAFAFEAGLGVVAIIVGWLVGHDPLALLRLRDAAPAQLTLDVLWGVAAAVPMIVSLLVLDRFPIGPFESLKRFVDEHVVPLFAHLGIAELALLSLAAGFGEEVLFRGLLQAGLQSWIGEPTGPILALIIASIVFGVCHWLTTTYAILATLVGLYFGALFLWTDSLVAPLIAHAAYDFVALAYLTRGGQPAAAIPTPPADDSSPLLPPPCPMPDTAEQDEP